MGSDDVKNPVVVAEEAMTQALNAKQPAWNEMVQFRLFQMPCCGHMLCWVNPRLPSHCPECGATVLARLKQGDCTLQHRVAWIRAE